MAARVTRSRRVAVDAVQQPKIEDSQQLPSSLDTPAPARGSAKSKANTRKKASPKVKTEARPSPTTLKSSRPDTKVAQKFKEDPDELPHNLGKRHRPPPATASEASSVPKKRTKTAHDDLQQQISDPQNQAIAANLAAQLVSSTTAQSDVTSKKGKKSSSYGHKPGTTPFPDYARPTPEECYEVNRLLSKVHGAVKKPEIVRPGSTRVAGCGEVPHVLDALIRTRLSANTNNENSGRAIQGIAKRFGVVNDEGYEEVDWNAVRLAPQQDLFEVIKTGGLANVKSKDIKKILDMVFEENQARREALMSKTRTAPGEENETEAEKKDEISKAKDNVLSLDYIFFLSKEEAFNKLITFPGIGAKTASCVMLFCLQLPSFAVDTHVWRLCHWLGWVPKNATRDQTFSHCEVRVPDELKYPLHQLLIVHGKKCPKCQAKLNSKKQDVDLLVDGECVLERLVNRFNHKGGSPGKRKAPKKSKKAKVDEEDDEDSEELSELPSEEE